jgi:MinD-like ATPase involved in chromosome partitioning or flagellar assembly
MPIIAFHSYRGGAGKSTLLANFAVALASRGKRVGLLELDVLSPGLEILFDLASPGENYYLNDLLLGEGDIEDAVLDLSPYLDGGSGKLYLMPASLQGEDIFRLIRDGYSAHECVNIIKRFKMQYGLEYLFIDTHPGFEEDTLLALAASDVMVVVLRIDQQDYFGAKIAIDIGRTLGKRLYLLLNMVPYEAVNSSEVSSFIDSVRRALGIPVVGIIPFYREILAAIGRKLFIINRRDHPFSMAINMIASRFMEETL